MSCDPLELLRNQNAVAPIGEQIRFVAFLGNAVRARKLVLRKWARIRGRDDIIGLIHEAREAGDRNEMVWRSFLAAHFGRSSADPDNAAEVHSAAWFLCAFGDKPVWTWRKTSRDWVKFEDWVEVSR